MAIGEVSLQSQHAYFHSFFDNKRIMSSIIRLQDTYLNRASNLSILLNKNIFLLKFASIYKKNISAACMIENNLSNS